MTNKFKTRKMANNKEWEKEMMKWCKNDIINLLEKVIAELDQLETSSLIVEKCKLIETTDDFISCYVTDCCNVGPIVNENYCPKCGKKIIRNDREEVFNAARQSIKGNMFLNTDENGDYFDAFVPKYPSFEDYLSDK